MPQAKYDWEALKRSFIHDPRRPSIRDFGRENSITEKTLANRASRENWRALRDEYWETVEEKSQGKLADLQATHVAMDTAQRLVEIRKMQEAALRVAGGTDGAYAVYENAGQAVSAYEKLIKLERLLTEQSTEILSVNDGRQIVAQIFQIIREEIRDSATLERIAGRLAGLGSVGSGATPNPDLN